MSRPEMTREELLHRLATLETELRHAQKLLNAPAKASNWRRFRGLGAKAAAVALMVVLMVGIAGGKDLASLWQKMNEVDKLLYVMGYYNGIVYGTAVQKKHPQQANEFFDAIQSWTNAQQIAIIDKYLQENPSRWNEDFGLLVMSAYKDAYEKGGRHLSP